MSAAAHDLSAQFAALWEEVEQEIPRAWQQVVTEMACRPPGPRDLERMRAKAEAGHLEHGGTIVDMTPAQLADEEQAEMDDLTIYRAIGNVLRRRRGGGATRPSPPPPTWWTRLRGRLAGRTVKTA